MHTKSQRMAQLAYERVKAYQSVTAEYRSFAREFPALVHTCGLAQAVAFAFAKKDPQKQGGGAEFLYVQDLSVVLGYAAVAELETETRQAPLSRYLWLSREALTAAVWLKRYVEALAEKPKATASSPLAVGG